MTDYGYERYIQRRGGVNITADYEAARIVAQHKSSWQLVTAHGEYKADLSGKYRYAPQEKGGYPTVGDYVQVRVADTNDVAVIHELMPRFAFFHRYDDWSAAGTQSVAANFDTVLICMSLNKDFNIPRLERYAIMARDSGANAAVVLTKADLTADVPAKLQLCQTVCGAMPVHVVSAVDGRGMAQLQSYFRSGCTVVALGSSGVGKSTLVNALYGADIMKVAAIREDDARGRHTTVHRQIVLLPGGGLYMDTPGMRELGLVDAEQAVDGVFDDIAKLADNCRFVDCQHESEPGCAVRAAMQNGELDSARYARYVKYQQEVSYQTDPKKHRAKKTQFHKAIVKELRKSGKM